MIYSENKNNYINIFSFFYFLFSFFVFSFQGAKKLLLWNTRANGDAKKSNLFYTLERDVYIRQVEWISANRIALGFKNVLIEIWQIDEKDETTNSRVIKQFKQDNVSLGISTILLQFVLPLLLFIWKRLK